MALNASYAFLAASCMYSFLLLIIMNSIFGNTRELPKTQMPVIPRSQAILSYIIYLSSFPYIHMSMLYIFFKIRNSIINNPFIRAKH